MSSLNQINVFDMTGAFVKSICVYGNADEPEALSLRDGVWYLLTNIPGSNKVWYWDVVTIRDTPSIDEIWGLAKLANKIPTAAEIGAIPAPSSPATGAFVMWDGSAWTAQTLSTWQGGSY
jgi:hypothetical protein